MALSQRAQSSISSVMMFTTVRSAFSALSFRIFSRILSYAPHAPSPAVRGRVEARARRGAPTCFANQHEGGALDGLVRLVEAVVHAREHFEHVGVVGRLAPHLLERLARLRPPPRARRVSGREHAARGGFLSSGEVMVSKECAWFTHLSGRSAPLDRNPELSSALTNLPVGVWGRRVRHTQRERWHLFVVAGARQQQRTVPAHLGVLGHDAHHARQAVDGLREVALLVRLSRQPPPYRRVLRARPPASAVRALPRHLRPAARVVRLLDAFSTALEPIRNQFIAVGAQAAGNEHCFVQPRKGTARVRVVAALIRLPWG